MKGPRAFPDIKTFTPKQIGWKRRHDLDVTSGNVWELPDGRFYISERGRPVYIHVCGDLAITQHATLKGPPR